VSLDNPNTETPKGIAFSPLNAKVDGEGLPRPPHRDAAADTQNEIRQLASDLRRSLDALPEKLDTIIYQSVSPSLQSLSLIISGLEGRFEGLENAVLQLQEQSGGAMQVHLGALSMRLDGVIKSQEGLNRQVHGLFDAVSQQANEETDRLVDTLNARFNGLLTLLNRVEERVIALELASAEISVTQNHHAAVQAQAWEERLARLEAILMSGVSAGAPMDKDDKTRPWWKRRNPDASATGMEPETPQQVIEVWDENARKIRATTPDIMPRPSRRGP
jgi:hypothetical protein